MNKYALLRHFFAWRKISGEENEDDEWMLRKSEMDRIPLDPHKKALKKSLLV